MKFLVAIASIYLAIWFQNGTSYAAATATDCSWETSTNFKKYTFNLLTSSGHRHGVRSEDGFYTVSNKSADDIVTTYWFQLCEHMQFNFNAPKCDQCESCGGPLHCGETCSALQSVSHGGYSACATLGTASNPSFSLIDLDKPETGLVVKMFSTGTQTCSFSVSVYCKTKQEEGPKAVIKDLDHKCSYITSLYHSAGCPVVTSLSRGGMGWFTTIVIMLLCLFMVYLAIGIGYRVTVLGVTGLEAIPNLDFWKTLPYKIQLHVEAAVSFIMGCYRQFTEPTYTRMNG